VDDGASIRADPAPNVFNVRFHSKSDRDNDLPGGRSVPLSTEVRRNKTPAAWTANKVGGVEIEGGTDRSF
jgi:hypothetical protein